MDGISKDVGRKENKVYATTLIPLSGGGRGQQRLLEWRGKKLDLKSREKEEGRDESRCRR